MTELSTRSAETSPARWPAPPRTDPAGPCRGSDFAELSRRIGPLACSTGGPATTRRDRPRRRAAGRVWAVFVCRRVLVAAGHGGGPRRRLHPGRASSATTPGTSRSAALAARPTTCSACCTATCGRVELRLVGGQAQPPPRPPEQRGQRPGHRGGASGLHRRAGPRDGAAVAALVARHQAYLFFPLLLLEGLQPARRQRAGVCGGAPVGAAGPSRRRCWPCTSAATSPLVFLVLTPLQAVAFIAGAPGRVRPLHGLLLRAQPQGHADPAAPTTSWTTCAGRCSPPATCAAAGSSTSPSAG